MKEKAKRLITNFLTIYKNLKQVRWMLGKALQHPNELKIKLKAIKRVLCNAKRHTNRL